MRELSQALRVKARLLAATDPDAVSYVAQYLYEFETAHALDTAALALAIFDGDAPYAEHAVRKAMQESDWVREEFRRQLGTGAVKCMTSVPTGPPRFLLMLLAHLQRLRRTTLQEGQQHGTHTQCPRLGLHGRPGVRRLTTAGAAVVGVAATMAVQDRARRQP